MNNKVRIDYLRKKVGGFWPIFFKNYKLLPSWRGKFGGNEHVLDITKEMVSRNQITHFRDIA